MSSWISSLVVVFTLVFATAQSQAQSADQPTAAPAVNTTGAQPVADAPAPQAATEIDPRAQTYRSIGATTIVLGGLLTAVGVSLAIGRDQDENLDGGGSSGNSGGRPFPAEVTIAGIGIAGLVAGLFLNAEARKIEAAKKNTAITPTVSETGVGIAVFGRF